MIVKIILNYCMGLVYPFSENDHLIIETFDKITLMLGVMKKKHLV